VQRNKINMEKIFEMGLSVFAIVGILFVFLFVMVLSSGGWEQTNAQSELELNKEAKK
jgi:hypothetical protein